MRKDDPDFVPPMSVHAQNTIARLGNGVLAGTEKRQRDDRMDEDERESKREKTADADDDDGEEMEIEDDEDSGAKQAAKGKNPGTSCDAPSFRRCILMPFQVRYPLQSNSHLHGFYVKIYRRKSPTMCSLFYSNSTY